MAYSIFAIFFGVFQRTPLTESRISVYLEVLWVTGVKQVSNFLRVGACFFIGYFSRPFLHGLL